MKSTGQSGEANAEIRFAFGESTLGLVLVAESERGLCAVMLGDDPDALVHELSDRFPRANLIRGGEDFQEEAALVVAHVEAPWMELNLPLDAGGTAFQQRVWRTLGEIPLGQTATYTEIAERIGAPHSARAVGQACAANPLAVVIPCHRAMRRDGGLAGYLGGVERKRALLDLEARQASRVNVSAGNQS